MRPRARVRPPKEKKTGRESKLLSPALIRQIAGLIQRGLPFDVAFEYVGLHAQRYSEWLAMGNAFLISGEPAAHEVYGDFVLAVRKARAAYILKRVDRIHTSWEWRRELALLERRDRRNFARIEAPGGVPESLDPDERFI